MYLRNCVALVTGGAQGLGKGFARAVLEAGGKVSLLDVKADIGQKSADEFNSQFGKNSAVFIACDVSNSQQVHDAFHMAYDTFGRLDLVVNNAGISTRSQDWRRTIDINLTALMCCCYAAHELMCRQGNGHIINIASAAGLTPIPSDPAYVASKHGVVGVSRSFSLLWESSGIRVNCLCPSFTETDLLRTVMSEADENTRSSILTLGVMKQDRVVDAFKKLLMDASITGGVLSVNPFKTDFKFKPRNIEFSAKL